MIDGVHIQVEGLRVRYGEKEVIHDLSFSADRGEFVAIVGKSGSGKSTLLHALAGFIESQGKILMPGDVGMVFQNYAVFPWLTVRGNLAFGLHGSNAHQRDEIVARLLEMTGLAEEAKKYPAQISGGQAQRVALGRALATDPEVILMDEPFGALDMYTREKMQSWLLDIWEKEHKTVLFVTHNIEEALFLSDRVLVFGQGKILREYPVSLPRPRVESLKFEGNFIELKRQIVETMERA
ncbi:MAG TPA: ABC transporter ATP-binding protein [Terriglobia bacterium]|nr:ABC transporter ATP-binding protein [Terriglobia bacterium]